MGKYHWQTQGLPKMIDHLDKTSQEHFDEVQSLLDISKTPYAINTNLVRGLDYYNMTAFEVTFHVLYFPFRKILLNL